MESEPNYAEAMDIAKLRNADLLDEYLSMYSDNQLSHLENVAEFLLERIGTILLDR